MSNNVDVVFVHPGAQHEIYGPLSDILTAVEPPIWTRMMAGWLRDHNYNVAIVDQEAERLSASVVAARVSSLNPRLVAIVVSGHQPSGSTQQMVAASEVARVIKKLEARLTIIMLGNHPSALPVRTIQEEHVDYVCDGEGPTTLLGLLKGDYPSQVPGLVWRDGDSIRQNTLAQLLVIDDLRGDVWDLLPMSLYRAHQWQCLDDMSKRQPYASIYTSLGCSFKCSFCMINVFQHMNRYRRRSPKKVVDQLVRLYRDYGVRTIKIADEMFVLNQQHYSEICEGLIAANGIADDLNIWAYARVDTVRADKLALLRKAGIRWLALGIESASAYVRDGAHKTFRNSDIMGVVREIQSAGINVIGNFMFGLPDDDVTSMEATLQLALELKCDWANFYATQAYPGSALYEQAMQEGWELPKTWAGYSQHGYECRPLDTQHTGAAYVLWMRDHAHRTYFTDPGYLDHVSHKFGSAAIAYIEQQQKIELPRALLQSTLTRKRAIAANHAMQD